MKKAKKVFTVITSVLCLTLVVPIVIPYSGITQTAEAATIHLSSSNRTMVKGQKVTLKISGTTKKILWSSTKKSIATVSSKGIVTAKSIGSATITAKVSGNKYKCVISVKKKSCAVIGTILKQSGYVKGSKTTPYYSMIGAIDGIKYTSSTKGIEIYKYKTSSGTYTKAKSTKKLYVDYLDDPIKLDAVKSGYVMFMNGYSSSDKKKIIALFNSL